jgi:hypothetical protein
VQEEQRRSILRADLPVENRQSIDTKISISHVSTLKDRRLQIILLRTESKVPDFEFQTVRHTIGNPGAGGDCTEPS